MIYCKVMAEPLFLTFPIINMIYEQIHAIFHWSIYLFLGKGKIWAGLSQAQKIIAYLQLFSKLFQFATKQTRPNKLSFS